ncbi:hypothetical protein PR202_gb21271 [Eleusine coracana subsp. coracana]|uniref:Uncharacterized protein n=1 Tax=Eleusine coracana subsp. coracana TaxID=191504 RepID=A0AAV5FCZ2_ELECO|nr:hypothetical protein PR202_gb21271 [Eleusine coracana subsp. coracana]
MKLRLHLLVLCVIIVFLVYNMANFQHRQTMLEAKSRPFETVTVSDRAAVKVSKEADNRIGYLPHGILEPYSDMELKPLWLTGKAQSQVSEYAHLKRTHPSTKSQRSNKNNRCLIAIAAGINQKKTVDAIMKKVLHVPLIYLNIVKSEGLEISQPVAFMQNDLIHGWGIDYKFGYCAQGDRTKNIGVVDSEFIVHRGVQTLGGSTRTKVRRKSRSELQDFQKRWDRAAREDRTWVDPFARSRRKRRNRIQQ